MFLSNQKSSHLQSPSIAFHCAPVSHHPSGQVFDLEKVLPFNSPTHKHTHTCKHTRTPQCANKLCLLWLKKTDWSVADCSSLPLDRESLFCNLICLSALWVFSFLTAYIPICVFMWVWILKSNIAFFCPEQCCSPYFAFPVIVVHFFDQ